MKTNEQEELIMYRENVLIEMQVELVVDGPRLSIIVGGEEIEIPEAGSLRMPKAWCDDADPYLLESTVGRILTTCGLVRRYLSYEPELEPVTLGRGEKPKHVGIGS